MNKTYFNPGAAGLLGAGMLGFSGKSFPGTILTRIIFFAHNIQQYSPEILFRIR
ncbi:MAG: hypothetical protein R6T99_10300 [Bacteroidales bacterium]